MTYSVVTFETYRCQKQSYLNNTIEKHNLAHLYGRLKQTVSAPCHPASSATAVGILLALAKIVKRQFLYRIFDLVVLRLICQRTDQNVKTIWCCASKQRPPLSLFFFPPVFFGGKKVRERVLSCGFDILITRLTFCTGNNSIVSMSSSCFWRNTAYIQIQRWEDREEATPMEYS